MQREVALQLLLQSFPNAIAKYRILGVSLECLSACCCTDSTAQKDVIAGRSSMSEVPMSMLTMLTLYLELYLSLLITILINFEKTHRVMLRCFFNIWFYVLCGRAQQ